MLSPILVGLGLPVSAVAPAALTSTFVTSIVGATTYTVLATTNPDLDIAPAWTVGLIAGAGGHVLKRHRRHHPPSERLEVGETNYVIDHVKKLFESCGRVRGAPTSKV